MPLLRRVAILAAFLAVPVLLALASQHLAARPGPPDLPGGAVALGVRSTLARPIPSPSPVPSPSSTPSSTPADVVPAEGRPASGGPAIEPPGTSPPTRRPTSPPTTSTVPALPDAQPGPRIRRVPERPAADAPDDDAAGDGSGDDGSTDDGDGAGAGDDADD